METRQSDEIGTLGQEAARAVSRLHSFSSARNPSCFATLCYPLIFGLFQGFFKSDVLPYLTKRYGGSPGDWTGLFFFGALGGISLMYRLYHRLRRTKVESVIFRRGTGTGSTPASRPQIWTGNSLFTRSFWPIIAFCVGMIAFVLLLRNLTDDGRPFLAFFAFVCFYSLARSVPTIFHPLMRVEEDGVQIKIDKLLWSQIERVQIESDLYNNEQTWWQFFDAQGKRLANVALKNSSLATQKEMASVIAHALDALPEEDPPFTPSERVTGNAYIPAERPY